jgi:epoxyqueuosine reductase QueG
MTAFADHPTALALRERPAPLPAASLTFAEVRALAISLGADDAAAVSLAHPDLAEERPHAERALPGAKTLVALVLREHPDDIRSPARSVANLEFHRTGHAVDDVAHRLTLELARRGHRTINPAMAFPMEMDQFPGRTWLISHKRVAVAAQLGKIGLHRNVIHPVFGSFILLGTVITTAEVEGQAPPLAYNPCVTCNLCVAACPVGAIEPSGGFRFSACYDHNYREFMTGFADLTEAIAESDGKQALRDRVTVPESASMWQSLSYGPNYKAAHCIAVCPAGEDVFGPFLANRGAFVAQVVKPLIERREPVYVVAGTDAEAHVRQRFPHKPVRRVTSSLRATSVEGFYRALPLIFQRGPAKGWAATFHFDLSGTRATIRIADGELTVTPELVGASDCRVEGDGQVWLDVVSKKRHPVWAVLTRKLKISGDRSLLDRFARCFPR